MDVLPGSWKCISVGEAVDSVSTVGKKIPQKVYLESGTYPVIDQGRPYIGGYTNDKSKLLDCSLPVIVFGDHTRTVKYVNHAFAVGADGVKVLRPHPFFLPKLFEYFIRYISVGLINKGYARHYQHLAKAQIRVPPLKEQHRIACKIEELFSELDKGIENLKSARDQLVVLRRVLLNLAATGGPLAKHGKLEKPFSIDSLVTLKEVTVSVGQGWSPRCHEYPAKDDDTWGVIKTSAIQPMQFVESKNKELPVERKPRIDLEILPGDVLITRAGPRRRVGIACLVKSVRPKLIVCDKVYRIQVKKERILPEYLVVLLNTPNLLNEIETLKSGINDSGLNLTQDRFLAMKVPVPSLEIQRRLLDEIERQLSNMNFLEVQIDDGLEKSEALRNSVMKRAFSGLLVSPDPNDEPAPVLLERIKVEKVARVKAVTTRKTNNKTTTPRKKVSA